jgi:hypothetical protein
LQIHRRPGNSVHKLTTRTLRKRPRRE